MVGITSVAKSLGALQVCASTYELFQSSSPVLSCVVSDEDAVKAVQHFANHHRMLVEPSCGATLALAYSPPTDFLKFIETRCRDRDVDGDGVDIVLVVCGGNAVNLEMISNGWGIAPITKSS